MDIIFRSLRNSFAGVAHARQEEKKVRLTLYALLASIPLGLLLASTPWQFVALVCAVLLSLCVELVNSCLEELCDHVTPERDRQIKAIKDMGSAAVFVAHLIGFLIWIAALLDKTGWF